MSKKRVIGVILCLLVFSVTFSACFITQSYDVAYAAGADNEIYYGDYSGNIGGGVVESETINYATYTETYQKVNPFFPDCYNLNNDITNGCANTAGVNILNYYDRYYDELIPDYTSGFMSGNKYIYYGMGTGTEKKQAVINTLYSYMKTNSVGAGTTQNDFKSGLTRYVNEKNRQISYNSILTNSAFDLNKFITQINNGKIVILYLSGFNFCAITNSGNTATITKIIHANSGHIEIAYGYQKFDYYDANGALITSKICLYVASGMAISDGNYLVNNNGVLDDAQVVNIY